MGKVELAAQEAAAATVDLQVTAGTLGEQAEKLKQKVDSFLRQVRFDDHDNAVLVTWGEDLEFGIPRIDNEHKRLMALVNRVYATVKGKQDPVVLAEAFAELRRYASEHFADEEAFMLRIGYGEAEEHRKQHQLFISRLDVLTENYRSGAEIRGIDVISLLGSWWQNHIKGSDGAVARFASLQKRAA
jgi:methyl-accepting chemotaxis protein